MMDIRIGVNELDTLCNALYGSVTYGMARNMKVEDVNKVLDYDGPLGYCYPATNDEWDGLIYGDRYPTNEGKCPDDIIYKDTYYMYEGQDYKGLKTSEYTTIFSGPNYWLSSTAAEVETSLATRRIC